MAVGRVSCGGRIVRTCYGLRCLAALCVVVLLAAGCAETRPGGAPLADGAGEVDDLAVGATASSDAPPPTEHDRAGTATAIAAAIPRGTAAIPSPPAATPAPPASTGGTASLQAMDLERFLTQSARGGALGATYRLTEVRVGAHEGFERVVWEMREPIGAPYFTVAARAGGDGGAAGVDGAGPRPWLEVILSDVYAREAPGALAPIARPEGAAILGIDPLSIKDDARLGFAVRLARPARFEAIVLEDPVRLVVDVVDGG